MQPIKNMFSQNTPEPWHTISVVLTAIITTAGALATACIASPTVFGSVTPTVLGISAGAVTVAGAIKLGIGSIGGNVNPNNITPTTAAETQDESKPSATKSE